MRPSPETPPERTRTASRGSALRRQHAELAADFDRIAAASRMGDWRECDALWDAFDRSLRGHLSFEEDKLFPEYEGLGSAQAQDCTGLRHEHDLVREQLDAIGLDLQVHQLQQRRIEDFVARLREHVRAEERMFYPWLSQSSHVGAAFEHWAQGNLDTLRGLRDEIRLQVKLASMDVKEKWQALEPSILSIERRATDLGAASQEALHRAVQKLRKFRRDLIDKRRASS